MERNKNEIIFQNSCDGICFDCESKCFNGQWRALKEKKIQINES